MDRAVWAPAKVNLFLRVGERDASGFHRIATLFAGLELHDDLRVELREGEGVELTTDGGEEMGPPEGNLVVRAARQWLERLDRRKNRGVAIHLVKRIPVGAGLGGGSSDAAAVLRALERAAQGSRAGEHALGDVHGVRESAGDPRDGVGAAALRELAVDLGSDVPFFLEPTPLALGEGRGEQLRSIEPLPPRPVVVVVPHFRVSTPAAYAALDGLREEGGREGIGSTHAPRSWREVARTAENDFEEVVFARHPDAGRIRDLLAAAGAAPALLSGSGSSLFGVFGQEEQAEAAARKAEESFPMAAVYRTRTLASWPTP